jgi:cephalosporin hydroxylase
MTAMQVPPTVHVTLDDSIHDYWHQRVEQVQADVYVGLPMLKFPEDLRTYEHLLWSYAPNAVIEIGTFRGGSTLWFRDRLRTLQLYGRVEEIRVISIDVDASAATDAIASVDPCFDETVTLLEDDVRDPSVPDRVALHLPREPRCFVVEDSAHVYDTTFAALEGFARFVPPGGFFVVEDGCVDIEEMRARPDWPRGVLPAIKDFMRTELGRSFVVRRDLELYGVSCHPAGFLQRLESPPAP